MEIFSNLACDLDAGKIDIQKAIVMSNLMNGLLTSARLQIDHRRYVGKDNPIPFLSE